MKLLSVRNKPILFIIVAGFAMMVYVELSLLNSALKGKEKDFNDKVFFVVSLYEEHFVRDTFVMNLFTSDAAAIRLVQTRVKNDLDQLFQKNDIPVNYVLALGKIKDNADSGEDLNKSQRKWAGNNLIWSGDSTSNKSLIQTKLRITGLGPKEKDYYVKIWFPSKPGYIFRELLPLIIVTVLTLITLFLCFLTLLSIIRRQERQAAIKNDFIDNMTHELKTPLFTISIASKMLEEQENIRSDSKPMSYLQSIQQETGRLMRLVDKVLQTSALDKKKLSLDRQELDVHATISAAVKSLDLIRKEQGATIELYLDAARSYVYADKTHLESVIFSLVDNAFKYSEQPAHITITTRNNKNDIQICFADRGIGLDIETKKLIFDRFFRAHTGNLHDVKGYGIGLSYVKAVIGAHDGTVAVNSTFGKGSEFIVSLPNIEHGERNKDIAGGR